MKEVLILRVALAVSIILGITFYFKRDVSEDKTQVKKLERELDSIKAKLILTNVELNEERRERKELDIEDSITRIKISILKGQDKQLIKKQNAIIGRFKNLTNHQLLDSLHKYYVQEHP